MTGWGQVRCSAAAGNPFTQYDECPALWLVAGLDVVDPVDQAGGVGVGQQSSENVVPRAVSAVAAMPLPQGLPRPELGWDVAPGQSAAGPVDDPLDHLAVLGERPAGPAV